MNFEDRILRLLATVGGSWTGTAHDLLVALHSNVSFNQLAADLACLSEGVDLQKNRTKRGVVYTLKSTPASSTGVVYTSEGIHQGSKSTPDESAGVDYTPPSIHQSPGSTPDEPAGVDYTASKSTPWAEIEAALLTLCGSARPIQIQAISPRGSGRPNPAFLFESVSEAAKQAYNWSESAYYGGVYWNLNLAKPGTKLPPGRSLSSEHIERRRWVLVDVEAPKPSSDSNATIEELTTSHELCADIRRTIYDQSGCWPLIALSGNGHHLLFPCDLPNTPEVDAAVSGFLKGLALKFNSGRGTVDTTVSNPARICKLPGTWARKGEHTAGRPHRKAELLSKTVEGQLLVGYLKTWAPPEELTPAAAPYSDPNNAGRPGAYQRAADWIKHRDPAVQGQNGDRWTFTTACHLVRGFHLPDEKALHLLIEWNESCVPPWTQKELATKIRNAHKNGSQPYGELLEQGRDVQPVDHDGYLPSKPSKPPTPPAPPEQPADEADNDDEMPAARTVRTRSAEPDDDSETIPSSISTISTAFVKLDSIGKARLQDARLPNIQVNGIPPNVIVRTTVEVLRRANARKKRFFWSSGTLSYCNIDAEEPATKALTKESLKARLDQVANFVRVDVKEDEIKASPAHAPKMTVEAMLCLDKEELDVPELDRIVSVPIFVEDGTLVEKPGYHKDYALIFQPPTDLKLHPVSPKPSQKQVDAARTLILDELLEGFRFVTPGDRANAIGGLIIAPFCRAMTGLTPLTMVEAPQAGNGKGLLVDACLAAFCGVGVMGDRMLGYSILREFDPKEAEKVLGAALIGSPSVLFIDNINGKIDSGQLCSILTSQTIMYRILGLSKVVELKNNAVWMATANNPTYTREFGRRLNTVRLDAQTDRPEMRSDFKHEDLLLWAYQNRSKLIWAALTLIQHWVASGRPFSRVRFGSYQRWASTIGGILDCAGIPGFCDNRDDVRAKSDTETEEWTCFCEAWYQDFGRAPVTTSELIQTVRKIQMPSWVFSRPSDAGQMTALGSALVKRDGMCIGDFRIERSNTLNKGLRHYRLGSKPTIEGQDTDLSVTSTRWDYRRTLGGPLVDLGSAISQRSTPANIDEISLF